MPYRRLPKTDSARLKALKTLLENNDIYTVKNRFIDWQLLNQAQPLYEKLLTACEQYKVNLQAQVRHAGKILKLQRTATQYVSHFLQVLFMCVERGEIKKQQLALYGLEPNSTSLPNLKSAEGLLNWGTNTIQGEKERIRKGGRPIYNPTIGMVSTHIDIFKENYGIQQTLINRTQKSINDIQQVRPIVDMVILNIWNQIEKHFENEPPESRYPTCRKLGVVYYYRRHEEHLFEE